jgi:uncharacterized protein (UPF0333 family)
VCVFSCWGDCGVQLLLHFSLTSKPTLSLSLSLSVVVVVVVDGVWVAYNSHSSHTSKAALFL